MFDHATCVETLFHSAKMHYSDMSHANLTRADFSGANLFFAIHHNVKDEHVIWGGATKLFLRGTDLDRLEAEAYRPPDP